MFSFGGESVQMARIYSIEDAEKYYTTSNASNVVWIMYRYVAHHYEMKTLDVHMQIVSE